MGVGEGKSVAAGWAALFTRVQPIPAMIMMMAMAVTPKMTVLGGMLAPALSIRKESI